MTDLATLDRRAWDRAQRRFRRMLDERTYGDPTSRSRRLYVQAERLLDRLRGQHDGFDLRADARMSALFDASSAELWELAEAELPDVPLAALSETEARALWGDR